MADDTKARTISGLHIYTAEEKAKKVKAKQRQLKKIFELLSDDAQLLCSDLMQNIAWMGVELAELQEIIHKTGAVEEYRNGANQSGLKLSAAIQAYNSLFKSYNSALRLLLAELPDGDSKAVAKDKLAAFLMGD